MSFFGIGKKEDEDKKKDSGGLFALGLSKGTQDAEEIRHRKAENTEKERHLQEEHHEQEVEKKDAHLAHDEAVKHDLEKSKQAEKERAIERDKLLGATKTD